MTHAFSVQFRDIPIPGALPQATVNHPVGVVDITCLPVHQRRNDTVALWSQHADLTRTNDFCDEGDELTRLLNKLRAVGFEALFVPGLD